VVERNLAKVEVEGSSPFTRSIPPRPPRPRAAARGPLPNLHESLASRIRRTSRPDNGGILGNPDLDAGHEDLVVQTSPDLVGAGPLSFLLCGGAKAERPYGAMRTSTELMNHWKLVRLCSSMSFE
jgi:hypothetical protein